MKTIYIKGIKKYKASLIKGLDKSNLIEGRDYIQGLAGEDHALYWLNEALDLRSFKLAIGAKYVFKHRMKFYTTIDEMHPIKNEDEFSAHEINLMNKIKEEYFTS